MVEAFTPERRLLRHDGDAMSVLADTVHHAFRPLSAGSNGHSRLPFETSVRLPVAADVADEVCLLRTDRLSVLPTYQYTLSCTRTAGQIPSLSTRTMPSQRRGWLDTAGNYGNCESKGTDSVKCIEMKSFLPINGVLS